MRQVRLGSYSMAATLAGTPSLLRLEVDDAVLLLVTAAAVAGGLAPVVVAATGVGLGASSDFSGWSW
jgi:hypothetical protein